MSLDSVLEDFDLGSCGGPQFADKRKALTIWVSPEVHQKYEEIQAKSGRKFNKVVRKLIERAILMVRIPA